MNTIKEAIEKELGFEVLETKQAPNFVYGGVEFEAYECIRTEAGEMCRVFALLYANESRDIFGDKFARSEAYEAINNLEWLSVTGAIERLIFDRFFTKPESN